jgi:hypothetical protein
MQMLGCSGASCYGHLLPIKVAGRARSVSMHVLTLPPAQPMQGVQSKCAHKLASMSRLIDANGRWYLLPPLARQFMIVLCCLLLGACAYEDVSTQLTRCRCSQQGEDSFVEIAPRFQTNWLQLWFLNPMVGHPDHASTLTNENQPAAMVNVGRIYKPRWDDTVI